MTAERRKPSCQSRTRFAASPAVGGRTGTRQEGRFTSRFIGIIDPRDVGRSTPRPRGRAAGGGSGRPSRRVGPCNVRRLREPGVGLGRTGAVGLEAEDAPADGGRGADRGERAAEILDRRRDDRARLPARRRRPGPAARSRSGRAGGGGRGRRRCCSRSSSRRPGWPGRRIRLTPCSTRGWSRHPSRQRRQTAMAVGSSQECVPATQGQPTRVGIVAEHVHGLRWANRQRTPLERQQPVAGDVDDGPRSPPAGSKGASRGASPSPASTDPGRRATSRPRAGARRARSQPGGLPPCRPSRCRDRVGISPSHQRQAGQGRGLDGRRSAVAIAPGDPRPRRARIRGGHDRAIACSPIETPHRR